uniref:Uncharacterized protein n=1 Tax=Onchocerca volvulus TaxID=6282 RepID=A0A8R1TTG4_ONCVO
MPKSEKSVVLAKLVFGNKLIINKDQLILLQKVKLKVLKNNEQDESISREQGNDHYKGHLSIL